MRSRRLLVLGALAFSGCSCGDGSGPAGGDGGADDDGGDGGGLSTLPGDPGQPVNEQLPDIDFPAPEPDQFELLLASEEGAFAVSRRDLVLVFLPTTTLGEANDLLAELGAEVVGSVSATGLLLVRLPDAPDPGPVVAAWRDLLEDDRVEHVMVNDAFAWDQRLPPRNVALDFWEWTAPPFAAGASRPYGNWGLEVTRLPQVWNLRDWLIDEGGAAVDLAAVDGGFSTTNPDLTGTMIVAPNGTTARGIEHGTMVLGIMGADWLDRQGVEGVTASIGGRLLAVTNAGLETGHTIDGGQVVFNQPIVANAQVLNQLIALVRLPAVTGPLAAAGNVPANLNLRAINNSYGINYWWYDDYTASCIVPTTTAIPHTAAPWWPAGFNMTWQALVDRWGDLYHRQILAADPADRVVLVASAGNDGTLPVSAFCPTGVTYTARDNSPLANAAARYGGRFVAAMATARNGALASSSNRNGDAQAPGECIRSTEDRNEGAGRNYDRPGCPNVDGGGTENRELATSSGTSFAAPHLTAVAGLVATARPGLSGSRIADILRTQISARWGVDAFAAVAAARGDRDEVMRALADIDDFSTDGNRRTARGPGNEVVDDRWDHDAEYVTKAASEPARRGDGGIDMADFRAFRDCFLEASAGLNAWLDGAADHSKRDHNQDGDFQDGSLENVYPRCDLNGDGIVAADAVPRDAGYGRPGFLADRTDVEVLQEVWPDDPEQTEGVAASELPGLLYSGDLEVHADALFEAGATSVTVTVAGPDDLIPIERVIGPDSRCEDPAEHCIVITVPQSRDVAVTASVEAGREDLEVVPHRRDVWPGSDARIDLVSGSLLYNVGDALVLADLATSTSTEIHEGYFWRGYCFSADGTHILAAEWTGEGYDLVWMSSDGSDRQVIVDDADFDEVEPRCPREGEGDRYFFLAEERDENGMPFGGADIYRLDRTILEDGGESWTQTNLTNDDAFEHLTYDVTPSGDRVAYTIYQDSWHESPCPLYVVDADGESPPELVTYSVGVPGIAMQGCAAPMHLSWSWDGTRIHVGDYGVFYPEQATWREDYLVVVSPEGGTETFLLTSSTDWNIAPQFAPPWNDFTFTATPTGGRIFSNFMCTVGQPGGGIFTAGAAGHTLLGDDLCGLQFSYSSDGSLVTFMSQDLGFMQVYVMNADGTNLVDVADGDRPLLRPRPAGMKM